ncbi:hypothetical protein EJF36_03355 [Bacillus sp. HMF5848]|uniref:TIGR04104 family putative zinc finger protein n=1 Tax=Bacillus sp. HMF5848 TaxID=2495421 RepID=UPI000F785B80|nr:TIGR04104 family putative zinc finger protein [Bacillus sp. HMF5848]RSK26011.1 hypothetical protein EJF36_03355 [Bacillus sp. HMF5848]
MDGCRHCLTYKQKVIALFLGQWSYTCRQCQTTYEISVKSRFYIIIIAAVIPLILFSWLIEPITEIVIYARLAILFIFMCVGVLISPMFIKFHKKKQIE